MSTTQVVLEALGMTAATVGIVLAQNPPSDLSGWWEQQAWLQWLVMPSSAAEGEQGLSILPWHLPGMEGARDAAFTDPLRGDYVNDVADD